MRCRSWAGWILVAAPGLTLASDGYGAVRCDNVHTRPCRITWELPSSNVGFLGLESFDAATGTWIFIVELPRKASGTTAQPVPGGAFYRVVSCKEAVTTRPCRSSRLHWAPFQAASAADLPPHVALPGDLTSVLRVHREFGLPHANFDYNLGLMLMALDVLCGMDMPAMTRPDVQYDRQLGPTAEQWALMTPDLWMHNEYYARYAYRREACDVGQPPAASSSPTLLPSKTRSAR